MRKAEGISVFFHLLKGEFILKNDSKVLSLCVLSLILFLNPLAISAETTGAGQGTSTISETTERIQSSTSSPTTTVPTVTEEVSENVQALQEGIIGEDQQTLVTDTTQRPYRQIVHLEVQYPNFGYQVGTGVMVGPDLILTAAHNVYNYKTGEWANEVYASPGRRDIEEPPYGVYDADSFAILSGFQAQGAGQYDMALIKLSQQVDSRVGQLEMAKTAVVGQRVQVPGFPFETAAKQYFMYTMFGEIQSISEKILYYQIDTERGQSGSPVVNDKGQVIGIHIAGFTSGDQYVKNGARIVDEAADQLLGAVRTGVGSEEVSFQSLTSPVYRLYHKGIKRHLYTRNSHEIQVLSERGWRYEGEKFRTAHKGIPVYRLYHGGTREHLYTTSSYERDQLVERGWRYEDVAWYSAGQKPIYRLYHAGLKVHLYTADTNEKNVLINRGWKDEGISFFAK